MEWKYVKKVNNVDDMSAFESIAGYRLCESFKDCILKSNGGRPSKKCFLTDKNREIELKSLLSINRDDKETLWDAIHWLDEGDSEKYVPFATDNFGNLICFDKESDGVVFYDHEDASTEMVASDFDMFIDGLYE